ncbi:FAD-dependent monooxygenase [Actinomadura rugatobispora]|uniref:FAD-dependent monooxygenase n=1 Tax=Actinomadura rugatobispora TaxID=1994 RepID=A0ABW0ZPT4_9ACTN|nr:FAD-dependent monooxygenase [Actinomadura rugatobispora]
MESPVVVVGAGPTGMMLAGELALAGADVLVLERLAEPSGESRGLGFGPRTMEIFAQRGILDDFGDFARSSAGHFGGIPLDFAVFDGAHFSVNGVPQSRTEAVLSGWLDRLGAEVRRGVEVTGVDAGVDGVDVHVTGPGGPATLRASYLVGCDGGRSTVRAAAGFRFEGTDPTLEMYLADVEGVEVRPRLSGEHTAGGMAMAGPIGGGVTRVISCELGNEPRERTEPPAYAEVAAAWKRLTGEDIAGGRPVWVSSFTDAARQATEYRRGRVFLAGDAAHISLPAGGQGMNTGVQDAANLGWKLAAQAGGRAPEGLLDTYHAERHPVGARLLRNTRAQGMLTLGGEAARPLRDVLSELMAYDEVARHLAGMVSGLDIRYDVGPGDHPLLGRRMPHIGLVTDGTKTTTTELLRTGRGVLLDLTGDADLRRAASGWSDRVDVVTAAPADPETGGVAEAGALLIRPDGHVAWTAPDGAGGGSDGGLGEALARWFGPPRI